MFGFGKKKTSITAPLTGRVIPVTEVPDPVFAQRMLGDGFAIEPDADAGVVEVCAPTAGRLAKVFDTLHAFALVAESGLEVFVHIGMDTVALTGEGCEKLASTGETVTAGQPIVRVDVSRIRESGRDPITPVVFTKSAQVASLDITEGPARGGDKVCTLALA